VVQVREFNTERSLLLEVFRDMGLTKESLDHDLLCILSRQPTSIMTLQLLRRELHTHVEENSLDIDLVELDEELETLVKELLHCFLQNQIYFKTIRYIRCLGHRSFLIEHR
jgi:hypothetical protein